MYFWFVPEKTWRALDNYMLPIVMGPSIDNYVEKLPPNSFIHVDNFTGPKDLVSYFKVLDDDDKIYRFHIRCLVELPNRFKIGATPQCFEGKFNKNAFQSDAYRPLQ